MSSSADGSSIYSNVLVEIASDDIGDGDATFNKLITYYELMEMQGDLSPIDAKLKDYLKDNHPDGSSTDFQPLPLGTFILPEGYAPNDAPPAKKASCCLRLGTLSLEGEVGPPIKPMAVLKRIERADPSPAVAVGSKRQREDEQPTIEPPAPLRLSFDLRLRGWHAPSLLTRAEACRFVGALRRRRVPASQPIQKEQSADARTDRE